VKSSSLSILLVFRNQKELAEQTLTAIYENLRGNFELRIADDASDDDTVATIQSVIEYFAHDETFFFEYSEPRGKAICYQELLVQTGSPVVWMPGSVAAVDGDALQLAVETLLKTGKFFAVSSDGYVPDSPDNWEKFLAESVSGDEQFLVNFRALPSVERFLNPFLQHHFVTDLILRVVGDDTQSLVEFIDGSFALAPETEVLRQNNDEMNRKELRISLSRGGHLHYETNGELPPLADSRSKAIISKYIQAINDEPDAQEEVIPAAKSDSESDASSAVKPESEAAVSSAVKPESEAAASSAVKPESEAAVSSAVKPESESTSVVLPMRTTGRKVPDFVEVGHSDAAARIKPEVDYLMREGEFAAALKIVESTIEKDISDLDVIRVKIRILERMRRYVEAAELKHQLKLGGLGAVNPRVRRETIVIGESTEFDLNPPKGSQDSNAGVEESGLRSAASDAGAASVSTTNAEKSSTEGAFETRPVTPKTVAATVIKSDIILGDDDIPDLPTGFVPIQTPEPEIELEPVVDLEPEVEPEIESEPVVELEPVVEREPEVEPEIESEPVVELEPEVEPEIELEPVVELEPEVEPELEPESAAHSDPGLTLELPEKTPPTISPQPILAENENPEAHGAVPRMPRISIVIPTTADGRFLLEQAVLSLEHHANLADRELIIVDNASLDDTHEYLDELRKWRFMHVQVIKNVKNIGFSASVNQAIDIARGKYILVMHNDVALNSDVPGYLADLMDANEDIAVMGPTATVSLNEQQRATGPDADPSSIRITDYVDSFCMILRRLNDVRFDPRYELGYFDDVDLCMQVADRGYRIAIARGLHVEHLGGATTSVLGLINFGRQYWQNTSRFNLKWGTSPRLPDFTPETDPLFRLVTISEIINPLFPEQDLVAAARTLLISEVRNTIVQTSHRKSDLYALIRLMMVLDQRDILRQLEEQLDKAGLDEQLLYNLVDFYFRKHIYSRCERYLQRLSPRQKTFGFRMMELRILMGDRKLEEATELLNDLVAEMPAHPELYRISGDIHNYYGNKAEAEKFYLLAHQADPFTYSARRTLLV
jgi:GT2 family glycosyltransferase